MNFDYEQKTGFYEMIELMIGKLKCWKLKILKLQLTKE